MCVRAFTHALAKIHTRAHKNAHTLARLHTPAPTPASQGTGVLDTANSARSGFTNYRDERFPYSEDNLGPNGSSPEKRLAKAAEELKLVPPLVEKGAWMDARSRLRLAAGYVRPALKATGKVRDADSARRRPAGSVQCERTALPHARARTRTHTHKCTHTR